MKSYNIGDWVVHPEAEHPWRITQNSLDKLDNTKLKLWEPQPNEWCWFIDGDKIALVKYISTNKDKIHKGVDSQYGDMVYSNEYKPYIGQLPSEIKNNK